VVCVSIFNAAEGLTDDVVTELVKTVEAREKYAKEVRISRTRRELGRHRVEHAEDASAETRPVRWRKRSSREGGERPRIPAEQRQRIG
jgi:hypothetical protein